MTPSTYGTELQARTLEEAKFRPSGAQDADWEYLRSLVLERMKDVAGLGKFITESINESALKMESLEESTTEGTDKAAETDTPDEDGSNPASTSGSYQRAFTIQPQYVNY